MIISSAESTHRVSVGLLTFARMAAQDAGAVRPTDVTRPLESSATGLSLMVATPAPSEQSRERSVIHYGHGSATTPAPVCPRELPRPRTRRASARGSLATSAQRYPHRARGEWYRVRPSGTRDFHR